MNMKNNIWLLLFSLIFIVAAACAVPVSRDVIKSDKQRMPAGDASSSDVSTLVAGNTGFALDIYQVLKTNNGNLFFSPYSISEALAMTYAGAAGTTMQQMAKTLHFDLTGTNLHASFNTIDLELQNRGKGSKGKDGKGFRLNVVNATWGQKSYAFLPGYLDILAQYYGAGIRLLDFAGSPEGSRGTINKWVSDQTENRIKDLIPGGAITPLTRLVLTNAIYFNAAWESQFTKQATTAGTFHKLDGQTITAKMMRQTKSFKYAETGDCQAIELPYEGQELSMIVILPKENGFNDFSKTLSTQKLGSLLGAMKIRQVNLSMPKFKTEASFSLKQSLTSLGMSNAFSDSADFSGIDGRKDIRITDVVHKTFVSVDEDGTEAAAATAVIMGATSMPTPPVIMTIDRPFIFLIRDKTGTVLFMGQILSPEAE
jgi:serpin B